MKKKLLSLMMATCMVAMVLTGCGQKEATGDDVKASVVESKESKEESEEESKEVEESTEEVVEPSEEAEEAEEVVEPSEEAEEAEEVVESSEEVEESEEVVESSEEVEESEEVVEPSEEVEETDEDETEVAVDSDIAKMYEGYLEKDDILPENVKISANTAPMGIAMDMIVAHAGDINMFSYVLSNADIDVYIEKEKVTWRYNIEGEDVWLWAPINSDDEAAEIMDMADSTLVEMDSVTSYAYRETIEEDGITYDLIDVATDVGYTTGSATYFVNRETQKVEKCVMEQDGTTVVCLIEEIDSIEIPEEAANAIEDEAANVAMCAMTVMLVGSGMAIE